MLPPLPSPPLPPPPLPPHWHLPKVMLIMGPPPSSPPPPPPEEWEDDMKVDELEEVSNKYFLIFFSFLINFTSPPSLPQATRNASSLCCQCAVTRSRICHLSNSLPK